MKKIILTIISLSICFTITAQAKTIRFATEATYPPFEYVNERGQISGFDIDVADALCKQLNVQCTFATQSFNSLIPSLNLGKYDALIAAIGITPARQKQIAFTQSYYQPSACFIVAKSKNYKVQDLLGKTIGTQEGTTFTQYLQNKFQNTINIKLYASIQDALLDLTAGRVDAVITDMPIATTWLKQSDNAKNYAVMGKPLIDKEYFGSGYGIGIRKDNSELLNSFNKALNEIKANGTYKKIEAKYFGVK